MTDTPSYEEMMDHHRRGGGVTQVWLNALTPGEVRAAPKKASQTNLRSVAKRLGVPIRTRTRDGVIYVVRLRDEDVPK